MVISSTPILVNSSRPFDNADRATRERYRAIPAKIRGRRPLHVTMFAHMYSLGEARKLTTELPRSAAVTAACLCWALSSRNSRLR